MGVGDGVDSIGGGGLSTAPPDSRQIGLFHRDDRQNLPALRGRRPHLRRLGTGAGVPRRPPRARGRAALQHRDPAAERDRLAAHGACAQQHPSGHFVPVRADARQGRAVAARHRPCRHRNADGGRAAVDGAAGALPPRHGPREIPRARVGLEGGVGRHHRQPAQAARRVLRLVARALHDGRRAVARGAEGVRSALQRRPDLQGQAAGQLGPEAAHRDLRPRSAADRGQGKPLAHQVSGRGHERAHHRRHHAARDDAGRHRGRGASGRRTLQGADRQERGAAAGRAQDSDRRRRIFRSGEGHRRGQDHAGARLQRLRGRQAAQPAAGERARRRRQARVGRTTRHFSPVCRRRPRSTRR